MLMLSTKRPVPTERKHLLLRASSFVCQQFLLSIQPPTITTKSLILANDTVTGNHQCDRIRGTGTSHCANRFLLAYRFRHFAIRVSLATWNHPELFPNLSLKCRSLKVERKIDARSLAFQVIDNGLSR